MIRYTFIYIFIYYIVLFLLFTDCDYSNLICALYEDVKATFYSNITVRVRFMTFI